MVRFVDPSLRLAQFLAERGSEVFPDEVREWVMEWIADVGIIMRSRSFIAYTIASLVSGAVLDVVPKILRW